MQRGIDAYCTACGAKRIPFASPPVNLAGQPSQVGGTIARVFGWFVLGGGLLAAVLVGALFQAIFPAGVLGWVLGSTIGLVAATLGCSSSSGESAFARRASIANATCASLPCARSPRAIAA